MKQIITIFYILVALNSFAQNAGRLPENLKKFKFIGIYDNNLKRDKSNNAINLGNDIEILVKNNYTLFNNNQIDLWLSQHPEFNNDSIQRFLKDYQKNYQLDFYVYGILTYPAVPSYNQPVSVYDANHYKLIIRFELLKKPVSFPYQIDYHISGIGNTNLRQEILSKKLQNEILPVKKTREEILNQIKIENEKLNTQDTTLIIKSLSVMIFSYLELLNNYEQTDTIRINIKSEIEKFKSFYENYTDKQLIKLVKLTEEYRVNFNIDYRRENIKKSISHLEDIIILQQNLSQYYFFLNDEIKLNKVLISLENNNLKLNELKKKLANEDFD